MGAIKRVVPGNLALVRSRATFHDENYFEEKTEVCIFGDEKGYRNLARILRYVGSDDKTVRVSHKGSQWGMALLLIPVLNHSSMRSKLKMFERIIQVRRQLQMELVIYGNTRGFSRLAKILDKLLSIDYDGPDDHIHVNDWNDNWIVKRSVSLNIRGPVRVWSEECLGDYISVIQERGKHCLPDGMQYLEESVMPYRTPVSGKSPFLSLLDSHRP